MNNLYFQLIFDLLDDYICMGFTCNQNSFSNIDDNIQGTSYVIIGLNGCLLLYLLVKMCRLCSYAFSYSNYHIHQTYKLHALCIINIMTALLVRKTQLDLRHFKDKYPQDIDSPNLIGYYIINDLFGIISIVTNNILLLFNAFSWLAIAKNCDYTVTNGNSIQPDQISSYVEQQDSVNRINRNQNRRAIYVAKIYFLYCFLPLLLVLSIFGTLNHGQSDHWCEVIDVSIVLSSSAPLIVFCIAFAIYLKKFSDPQISLKTKIGLVYLLVALITRSIFFLIFLIKSEESSTAAPTTVFFSLFCSLGPMVVMALLSEVQLHKQQFNLLRRSTGLIFKSTII